MSDIYLVNINNADWISNESDVLIAQCTAFAPEPSYRDFRSFQFIDGTGYVETVRDEIDLILQSNKGHCYIENPDTFIQHWQIADYADHKLSELSGGWKKYLSLALFTNLTSSGKIYFDTFRQLSDRLILLLLRNLLHTKVSSVFLFDYDVSLFPQGVLKRNIFLASLDGRFTDVPMTDGNSDLTFNETNYHAGD